MLPVETILAVFPSAVAVGKITLRPLTLNHVVAMESLGIETEGTVSDSQVFIAAWIMSKEPDEVVEMLGSGTRTEDFDRWFLENKPNVDEMLEGVKTVFSQAYLPFVPGEQKEKKVSVGKTGFGWPLEVAEAYASEYGVDVDEALSTPLSRIFGLLACARQRNGGKAGGPDYYERMTLAKLKRKRHGN